MNTSETGRTKLERWTRRRRAVGGGVAFTLHALFLAAIVLAPGPPPIRPEPEPIEVSLVEPVIIPPPKPPAPPAPEPAAAPTPAPASAPKAPEPKPQPKPVKQAKASPPRVTIEPQPTEVPPRFVPPAPPEPAHEIAVSEAELAMATTAESEAAGGGGNGDGSGDGAGGPGGGGGRCDMVNRLQRALRNDWRVRSAIAGARRAPGFAGRPLVIWNGDWVRHGDEEGKGLASVRQAIAVEVAFAPKACRSQSVHGLVLLSINGAPARLVLGKGAWRWQDLVARE